MENTTNTFKSLDDLMVYFFEGIDKEGYEIALEMKKEYENKD